MATSRIDGDLHVKGSISCAGALAIPSGTVTDDDVVAAAGIAASKLGHQFVKHHSQETDTKTAAGSYVIHTVYGTTNTIQGFEAGSTTLCTGTAAITVDLVLWRAGTSASVLDSVITLDVDNLVVYLPEVGTVKTSALVDGDTLQVVYTSADGTGAAGNGGYASVILREDAD